MDIFSNNVYENVRTRVIVTHADKLLLLEPAEPGAGWRLPGGGMEPNECLADCGEREIFEETGIRIKVTNVAFLREFVIPKYCPMPEANGRVVYTMEVYLYSEPLIDQPEPRREGEGLPLGHWIPFAEVSSLPLWPKELKTLGDLLAAGQRPGGVPSFVAQLESPDVPGPEGVFG